MDELRQKPLASQSESIFILMIAACANPCYEYEEEPKPVFKAVGYFSTLEKALAMRSRYVYVGQFGWHSMMIKEAFLDPEPQTSSKKTWLPLTESDTKTCDEHNIELPDWEFVPERAVYEKWGGYDRSDDIIKELKAQIRELKAQVPNEKVDSNDETISS